MLNIPEEIKDLLHEDTCQKNIRIHFPNGERTDICNDLIVRDSVSFTESLCSQEDLKFGLCESPVFECEVVGVGNIKGANIEVSCEIYCPMSVTGAVYKPDLQAYIYSIPLGSFIVSECQKQADMAHRRVIAYGYLQGKSDNIDMSIAIKDTIGLSSALPYNPNIFATMVVNSGIKTRINQAIYTEIDLDSNGGLRRETYTIPGTTEEIRLDILLKSTVQTLPKLKEDGLYYVEKPQLLKTQIEAFSAAFEELKNNPPSASYTDNVLEQIKKWALEKLNAKKWEGLWSIYNLVRIETYGNYIYPYLRDNPSGLDRDNVNVYYGIRLHCFNLDNSNRYEVNYTDNFFNPSQIKLYEVDYSMYPQTRFDFPRYITENSQWYYDATKIDYYALTNAMLELSSLFWYADHNGGVKLINLQRQFGITPSHILYPGATIYPQGVTGGKLLPEDYQSCWYDDEYSKPYGAVVCQFKNTNNEECLYTLYMTGITEDTDPDTYKTYELTDNEIIRSSLWTEEQIADICNTIAANISGVQYMPVDFVGRGLPYVEAGDTFEILTKSNDSITTIVLNRTLTGEQYMVDSYKSVNT